VLLTNSYSIDPSDSTKLPRGHWAGGFDIMGLINGTHPDYLAWHKWKLNWLSDSQISCITAPGTTKHTIAPIEVPGGVKAAAIKLSPTTAFVVEVRSQLAVNNTNCPLGLVAYLVDTQGSNGNAAKPPVKVIDTHGASNTGCEPARGGKLTGAAIDFAKGEKGFIVSEYGVNVTIQGVKNGSYDIDLTWSGAKGAAAAAVPKASGESPWAAGGDDEDEE
jgi:hypothetical protein